VEDASFVFIKTRREMVFFQREVWLPIKPSLFALAVPVISLFVPGSFFRSPSDMQIIPSTPRDKDELPSSEPGSSFTVCYLSVQNISVH
jgi:hypothetical protein